MGGRRGEKGRRRVGLEEGRKGRGKGREMGILANVQQNHYLTLQQCCQLALLLFVTVIMIMFFDNVINSFT